MTLADNPVVCLKIMKENNDLSLDENFMVFGNLYH